MLLLHNIGQLVTLAGANAPRYGKEMSELGIIEDGAILIEDDRIVFVGTSAQATIQVAGDVERHDIKGQAVIPGFVDPHTHAVFAGNRADEFGKRLAGASYLDILAAGGGILDTVRKTRAASQEDLESQAGEALRTMLEWGTTTVEIKSGYGLDYETELKQLEVIKKLGQNEAYPTLVATFLGAHALPPEYADKREAYIDLLCNELIPLVAERSLAKFCDVFCEEGVFTIEESHRILETGRQHGLLPKVHADEIVPLGGAGLAADLKATSADHLCFASEPDLAKMAEAGTIAVLLPGTSFMLRHKEDAPARRMIELGLAVALATDYNPGTCPVASMPLMIGLACLRMNLTPAEALVAATINAAWAIGQGDKVGSLEVGKQADLLILDVPSYTHIPYFFGKNLVRKVFKAGKSYV